MLKVLIIGSNGLIGNNLSKFLNTKKNIFNLWIEIKKKNLVKILIFFIMET